MVGRKLTEAWGQQVIIDPQGGGGGLMSGSVAAKAPPDGHTLLLATGSHTISPSFYKLPYDMVRDFEPVSLVATIPFLLVVNNTLPARSVPELVKLAKARPGQLNFGSGGNGSPGQLFAEMFKHLTDTNMVHIPYKTLGNALTDVISGQVQLMFTVGPLALPQVKSGRVRALGVTTANRSRLMPEFPTLAESGVPGYDAMSWNGFLAPAGTPAPVIAKLHAEIVKAMNSPDVAEHVTQLGYEPAASSPQELGELIKSELAKWAKVAQQAGLKPN
jgi:tripartite-type tricarboxylate transporter receptor subunit TctC